jgi:hypothetical protein
MEIGRVEYDSVSSGRARWIEQICEDTVAIVAMVEWRQEAICQVVGMKDVDRE